MAQNKISNFAANLNLISSSTNFYVIVHPFWAATVISWNPETAVRHHDTKTCVIFLANGSHKNLLFEVLLPYFPGSTIIIMFFNGVKSRNYFLLSTFKNYSKIDQIKVSTWRSCLVAFVFSGVRSGIEPEQPPRPRWCEWTAACRQPTTSCRSPHRQAGQDLEMSARL